jgi:signal transduction histidine kinase
MVLPLALIALVSLAFIGQGSLWPSSQQSDTVMLSRVAVAVIGTLNLLALALALWQTHVLDQAQQQQQKHVDEVRADLENQVAQRTADLTELTRHLQTAREDERDRLARDLHDELGALLTSAKLDAARIRSRLAGQSPEALERLAHLVSTLDSVITLKRRITEDLRPSSLGHLGLVATLEILAREFTERSGIQVHCTLAPVVLAPPAELMVYRLVQEAINNISKHARARQVWLNLSAEHGWVEVAVRDDGVGFDTRKLSPMAHGLLGMRYRVEAERGALRLHSFPGQGTTVSARWPLQAPLQAPLQGPPGVL